MLTSNVSQLKTVRTNINWNNLLHIVSWNIWQKWGSFYDVSYMLGLQPYMQESWCTDMLPWALLVIDINVKKKNKGIFFWYNNIKRHNFTSRAFELIGRNDIVERLKILTVYMYEGKRTHLSNCIGNHRYLC